MLALDTEDDSQGTVKIINFFDGNKHTSFTGKNLQSRAWAFLSSKAPEQVWACNTEYDLINLFGPWVGKLVTLTYVKSGLMRGSFRESRITFLDTLRHWPMTVEKMGEYLNLPKIKIDLQNVNLEELLEYCKRDTEIVWRFISEMLVRYEVLDLKIKATLPSMALQLFKQFYPYNFPVLPDYLRKWLRRGYYGGRVEVYQYGKVKGPIYHYDVNSLFPSVMFDYEYPNLSSWMSCHSPDLSKEGMFEGRILVPESYIPCLPVRDDFEILYPHGSIYGVWPYPEVRQVVKDGGEILYTKYAVEFEVTECPFRNYVKFCYKRRLQAKNDLDDVFWKLMLNSLYGKFGQTEGLEIIYDDKQRIINTSASQSNVIWSAYVTSYARLRLLSYLRSCSKVYYTDTDSVFTSDILPTGKALGQLKQEGMYKEAEFVGNKLYILDDEATAKGIPREAAKDFIRTGRAIFKRPARFRESRRTFAKVNVWYDVEKKLEKQYTKRRIKTDGETEPWGYSDYIKFKSDLK